MGWVGWSISNFYKGALIPFFLSNLPLTAQRSPSPFFSTFFQSFLLTGVVGGTEFSLFFLSPRSIAWFVPQPTVPGDLHVFPSWLPCFR